MPGARPCSSAIAVELYCPSFPNPDESAAPICEASLSRQYPRGPNDDIFERKVSIFTAFAPVFQAPASCRQRSARDRDSEFHSNQLDPLRLPKLIVKFVELDRVAHKSNPSIEISRP